MRRAGTTACSTARFAVSGTRTKRVIESLRTNNVPVGDVTPGVATVYATAILSPGTARWPGITVCCTDSGALDGVAARFGAPRLEAATAMTRRARSNARTLSSRFTGATNTQTTISVEVGHPPPRTHYGRVALNTRSRASSRGLMGR